MDLMYRDETFTVFRAPVSTAAFPNYSRVVKTPMDLGTIRANIVARRYVYVEDFDFDIRAIHSASDAFNGATSNLTKRARELVRRTDQFFKDNQRELRRLQERIQSELRSLHDRIRALPVEVAQGGGSSSSGSSTLEPVMVLGDDEAGDQAMAPPPPAPLLVQDGGAAAAASMIDLTSTGDDDEEIVLESGKL